MNIWSWFPPLSHETALHIDLATAFIALLALAFSIWTWRHQTRLSIEAMRIERDNDLIRWIDAVIDVIVDIEFLLRNPPGDPGQFGSQRNTHLARLAAVIDKGRLYFPGFTRDMIGDDGEPLALGVGPPLLDDLVQIYDLVRNIDLKDEKAVATTRRELMMKKRNFVIEAQDEVEIDRRLIFKKRRGRQKMQGLQP